MGNGAIDYAKISLAKEQSQCRFWKRGYMSKNSETMDLLAKPPKIVVY
jgi:hypothetical protein